MDLKFGKFGNFSVYKYNLGSAVTLGSTATSGSSDNLGSTFASTKREEANKRLSKHRLTRGFWVTPKQIKIGARMRTSYYFLHIKGKRIVARQGVGLGSVSSYSPFWGL